jgi:hypothetical protein
VTATDVLRRTCICACQAMNLQRSTRVAGSVVFDEDNMVPLGLSRERGASRRVMDMVGRFTKPVRAIAPFVDWLRLRHSATLR